MGVRIRYIVETHRHEDFVMGSTHLAERTGAAHRDGVKGALAGGFGSWWTSGKPLEQSGVMTPRVLAERRNDVQILDVREPDEFASGHIPEAQNEYVGHLEQRLTSAGKQWRIEEYLMKRCRLR